VVGPALPVYERIGVLEEALDGDRSRVQENQTLMYYLEELSQMSPSEIADRIFDGTHGNADRRDRLDDQRVVVTNREPCRLRPARYAIRIV